MFLELQTIALIVLGSYLVGFVSAVSMLRYRSPR